MAKKRRYIPLSVRLKVALRQLAEAKGCLVKDLQLDHDPALNFRPMNARGSDTVPPANSPVHLIYRVQEGDHKVKTFGPGGEKRIHTRGSDVSEPGRLDRIAANRAEFQRRMKMNPAQRAAERERQTSKWPKGRGFPKSRGFDKPGKES